MDLQKLKAPFPRDRVSWRAQTVTRDGSKALALAYIDARDVMERLDEIVGVENWQCRYSHADKKTICEIGIKIGDEWVWKADGAGDSDIEAEKGALSDSLKRAAVRWGIGRYLYDLETPWVPCESRDFNGKKQFVKFTDDPWRHVKPAEQPDKPQHRSARDFSAAELAVLNAINAAETAAELAALLLREKDNISAMAAVDRIRDVADSRMKALKAQSPKAAA